MWTSLWAAAIGMVMISHSAAAQRIADVAPGTLVRLSMRQGAAISGPLAEVRTDSILLSSTVRQAARAIPLTSVRSYQFAEGERSHAGAGALIGGMLGLAVCVAIDRDKDEWASCNTASARTSMFLALAFPGILIGNGIKTTRWVSAGEP